ncbi:MAG TPA: proton-conducting transporter membrane subunit [Candidatus Sulfotelmatobacter sp.]|nr:proton-conducting transporter membrane subunit [Candidatus Sulfotelmatobacter sp.]
MSALAPLALAVPLIAAALTAGMGTRVPRAVWSIINIVASAFATAACAALAADAAVHGTVVHWFGGWHPAHGVSLGIAFVVDPAGAALAALAAFLTLAAFVYAWTYYNQDDGAFVALLQVFSAALIGFFLTGDIFDLFVFFELMSVAAYALTGFRSEDSAAVEGALSFAVVNSTGAFFVLAGITLLYGRTGALLLAQIAHALAAKSDPLVLVAFALIVVGFLVKASIVPFHFWLAEAHAVAPTPLCALFSGIMVEAGLYAVARIYWSVFSGALGAHAEGVRDVLLAFGLATAVVGSVMAYAQRHFKRLLAFSTVAHSGLMLCGIALFGSVALGGFFVYVLGHGLVKGALFFGSGIMLNRWSTVDVEDLRGKLRELPWLAAVFALGALALAGMPPCGLFVGSALIARGAAHAHLGWVMIPLGVSAALTGAAVLNAVGRMTFGWGPPPDPRALTPGTEQPETAPAQGARLANMAVPTLVLLVLSFVVGLLAAIPPTAIAAAMRFVDRPMQEALLLHAAAPVPLGRGVALPLRPDLVHGLGGGLLAIGFASIGLFAHRLRRVWALLARLYESAMRIPHAWHSGIVTDYVTWLIAGAAAFGAAILSVVR